MFYLFLYFHLMHHVELFIKEGYFYVRMFIRSIHVRDFRFNQFDEIILKRILSGKHKEKNNLSLNTKGYQKVRRLSF